MYIVQAIRKNVDGKSDYIFTPTHANGRALTFNSIENAMQYAETLKSGPFPVYGVTINFFPV
jgi:hypothetical protein